MMNIAQQIIQDLQSRKKVELSGLGTLHLITKHAEVDEANDKILPPKQEIEFVADKKAVENNYTAYAQEWVRELLTKEQIEVEGLGKWINNAGKIIFFPQEKILNNSFYGLEEISLPKVSKIQPVQELKKQSNNSDDYKANKSWIWICIGIVLVGAVAYLGIMRQEDIFGKKSFEKNQPPKVIVPTKEELLKKKQLEAAKMKLDSIKADSIKQDSINKRTHRGSKNKTWRKRKKQQSH
ncbi:hypothetical protein KRE47_14215 [Elizabethkingia meningoseptica]|uniref:hypothetical protein n=1 Tax=Elizabethkingia meningoseptica TaxID=238 RepID=UPI000841A910|nr:hypothetical protein [Elizabethkingia meningoseptica]EJK5328498.1 hypothetical protein [Elizabethkingia meningoseptica]EJK5330824.1 hypothetical protein [Elizabethkingia meningoseptica]MDE5468289.1 hypothetical protein [Elizabethkingia meningoseptica]MDE5475658.1 hypothetical protein [Elizabethkingia meningoseptica]MDE5479534.1 hypothetical protein [Elizabethkingia meningoseptica]